jgi:hypothetical protein
LPVGWVISNRFFGKRRFGHDPINTLPLPGNACHWQPVLNTYVMASKIVLSGIGFLPSPGFLLYFLFGSRFGCGITANTAFSLNRVACRFLDRQIGTLAKCAGTKWI